MWNDALNPETRMIIQVWVNALFQLKSMQLMVGGVILGWALLIPCLILHGVHAHRPGIRYVIHRLRSATFVMSLMAFALAVSGGIYVAYQGLK
jgi:hypothetical protein